MRRPDPPILPLLPFEDWAKQVEVYTEPLLIERIGEHREEMEAPLQCLSNMLRRSPAFCRGGHRVPTLDRTHEVWMEFRDAIPYLKEELGVEDTKLLEGMRDAMRDYLDSNGWQQGKSPPGRG